MSEKCPTREAADQTSTLLPQLDASEHWVYIVFSHMLRAVRVQCHNQARQEPLCFHQSPFFPSSSFTKHSNTEHLLGPGAGQRERFGWLADQHDHRPWGTVPVQWGWKGWGRGPRKAGERTMHKVSVKTWCEQTKATPSLSRRCWVRVLQETDHLRSHLYGRQLLEFFNRKVKQQPSKTL